MEILCNNKRRCQAILLYSSNLLWKRFSKSQVRRCNGSSSWGISLIYASKMFSFIKWASLLQNSSKFIESVQGIKKITANNITFNKWEFIQDIFTTKWSRKIEIMVKYNNKINKSRKNNYSFNIIYFQLLCYNVQLT